MKKWLALGAKIVVSAALIWWLFRDKDLHGEMARVMAADAAPMLAAAGLLLVQVVVVSLRWHFVLTGIGADLPFGQVVRFFYISSFFNQALPASVGGDAVRVYKAHKAGLGLGPAFNSALLDRVAALVAVVVMMAATLPLLFARIGDPAARAAMAVMIALAVGAVVAMMVLDKLPAVLHRWRAVRVLAALAADSRRIFMTGAHTPKVMAVAVLGHVVLALSVWSLAAALRIDVGALDCILLFPPVILISSLPVSIAGWGVREGAMVAVFGFVGVPEGAALVLSILFGLMTIAINLPGGALWLAEGGRTMPPESRPS